jgi:hypothetical protein
MYWNYKYKQCGRKSWNFIVWRKQFQITISVYNHFLITANNKIIQKILTVWKHFIQLLNVYKSETSTDTTKTTR